MDNKQYEGKLVRWNEEKGFGFIQSNNQKKDVFLHISSLKKMSRRPVIGDIIFYQIHIENDGKYKAINARIQGVSSLRPQEPNSNRKKFSQHENQSFFSYILIFLIVGFVAYSIYSKYGKLTIERNHNASAIVNSLAASPSVQTYRCEGKVHCSEMTSCEEAIFYQRNCLGTKMDGDGDGNPCEDWCGH